jgi:hypothetical protein
VGMWCLFYLLCMLQVLGAGLLDCIVGGSAHLDFVLGLGCVLVVPGFMHTEGIIH